MDENEMVTIAEKIKDKTATNEEITAFLKEYNKLLTEIKDDLIAK